MNQQNLFLFRIIKGIIKSRLLNKKMETFKPFRSNALRKRKYHTQRRMNEKTGVIFNLPKEVIERDSLVALNSSIIQPLKQKKKSFSQQHRNLFRQNQDLRCTFRNHSYEISNQKGPTFSLISVEKIRSLESKMNRNQSLDIVSSKKLSFQTLNILYRTIIQTNAKSKPKPHFQVNAKKLPILQKLSYHSKQLHRDIQFSSRRSSSSRQQCHPRGPHNYKLNILINKSMDKNRQNKNQSDFSLYEQNQEVKIINRRRRFEHRSQSSKGNNEIVPWGHRVDAEPETIFG